jgi:lipopolysaccharide biosynthesis glycosyltransferase
MNIVALFSDVHMLPGLHVTLLSMLRAFETKKSSNIKIILYLDAVPKKEHLLLYRTHELCHKGSTLEIVDYSPKSPTGGDLLHGNATAYGRINLSHLLPSETRCVYLDCDLVVNKCISEIFEHFDGEHVLLVDGEGKREFSLDKNLFEYAGLDITGSYFNSGVMGIDLALWRKRKIDSIIESTSKNYKGKFKCADQSLLNLALHSSFKSIGKEFNSALYPSSPACDILENRIYHFIGSPKPWDLFGSISSNHFQMWKAIYKDTAISSRWYLKYSSMKRLINISKQSFKALKKTRKRQ